MKSKENNFESSLNGLIQTNIDSFKLKSDEYEANSRIIQRLASSGIISAELLDEEQLEKIMEVVGLKGMKLFDKTLTGKVVTVEITEPKSGQEYNELAFFIGHEVLRKIAEVPKHQLKDTKVTVTFSE